jgi:3-oxoisoapionate kinase
MSNNDLLLAFYGDDFTGSTDALEFLTRAGATTALFIEPPSAAQLAAWPGLHAIGVAGMTRAMHPADMEKALYPAFEKLRRLGARHVHYKVCSTFDSSPVVGSIGKAIDVGMTVFDNSFIPLLVAAPSLGRYCLFGNLFARLGIGSSGEIYRLDRHPSMSQHPVTPADESDLRLHLGKQTNKKIGLIDILQLGNQQHLYDTLKALIWQRCRVVLFDALYEDQLRTIGECIDSCAVTGMPLFSVGSSGIEMALGKFWNEKKLLTPLTTWPHPGKAAPLLVISGSCSPVTAGQIAWALNNGFKEVVIDAPLFSGGEVSMEAVHKYIQQAIASLQQGASVIVHTGGAGNKNNPQLISASHLGTALGTIAREAVTTVGIKRVGIAGGDTSSYAARAMGVEAVHMIAPVVAGAPLCKAKARYTAIDGIEINFKGGQVGDTNYFGLLLEGNTN